MAKVVRITADGLVHDGKGGVSFIIIRADPTTPVDSSIKLYDATAIVGDPKLVIGLDVSLESEKTKHIVFLEPVEFKTAIYADVEGTGAVFYIGISGK